MTDPSTSAAIRAEIKATVRRHKAFCVTSEQRAIFRQGIAEARSRYGPELENLHPVPVSTIEARSQVRTSKYGNIILFDFEEANAISFLIGRFYSKRPPISFYNEYMIRAAESLFVEKRFTDALRISEIAHARYEQFARKQGTHPHFEIAMNGNALPATAFAARYIPLILLYHEIGHVLIEHGKPEGLYKFLEKEFDKGNITKGQSGVNFTVPDIVIKIGPDHDVVGQNIEGMKFASTWKIRRAAFIEEAFCDAISFILSCYTGINEGVPAPTLHHVFVTSLLLSEAVGRIRNIALAMPRELTAGDVRFAISTNGARLYCLNKLVKRMQRGSKFADGRIRKYVKDIDIDDPHFEDSVTESLVSNQLYQLSRGALGRGVMKGFANDIGENFRVAAATSRESLEAAYKGKYGEGPGAEFMESQMRLLAVPHELPDHLYSIEASFDADIIDPFIHGFCAAVRDIAAAIYDPKQVDDLFGTRYLTATELPDSEILEIIRTSRHIARRGSVAALPVGLP
jgi:hypothetical protein